MIVEFTTNEAAILKDAITLHFEDYDIKPKYHTALKMAKSKISRAMTHAIKMERLG